MRRHSSCSSAVAAQTQELALQRNSQRQGLDALPAAVVTRLAAAFEQPQPGRHHWEEAATLTVHCCSGTVTQPGAHACTALSGAGDGVQGATAATDAGQGSSLAE
jgi:tRNA uridine 5-carbamoylmethylation protein Kti12